MATQQDQDSITTDQQPVSQTEVTIRRLFRFPFSILSRCEPENQLISFDNGKYRKTIDGFIVIYVDGSCLMNGKSSAVASYGVFFGQESPFNTADTLDLSDRQTNNSAEIAAITEAIRISALLNLKKIEIRTDSLLVIRSLEVYLPYWAENGWKTANRKDVKNKVEFEKLIGTINASELEIRVVHVRGHMSEEGNNFADFLAKYASFKKSVSFNPTPDQDEKSGDVLTTREQDE